ncbi:MAG: hypothetical protein ACREUU_01065 [Gammaproteobacteria bacterium]
MKSIQLSRHSQQFRACSLAALVLIALSATSALAGDVRSGTSDVNKVFGRSSAMPAHGAPVKTAGLSVDAFGRSSNHIGKTDAAINVATRSTDGLIGQYGRGTPSQAITQKGTSSGKVAAKAR